MRKQVLTVLTAYLSTQLLNLRRQLLTLLSILPLRCLLALHDLQEVEVLLLELLLLQQELVEGGHPDHVYPRLAFPLRLRPQIILPLVLPAVRDGEAELTKGWRRISGSRRRKGEWRP